MLRRAGIAAPDDLAEKEGERLWVLHAVRKVGLSLPDDTPIEELLCMDAKDLLLHRLASIFGGEHPWRMIPESHGKDSFPPVFHFHTKVAGVTFKNDDGSERQKVLSTCVPLQTLRVEHEDSNPHDPNAIRVCTEDGRQIGHLFRAVAFDVWQGIKQGFTHVAICVNLTGGTTNKPSLGMNVLMVVGRPGVSQEEIRAHLVRIMPAVAADIYDYHCYLDDDDDDDDDINDGERDEPTESDDDSVLE